MTVSYMQNHYFMLYDGHSKPVLGAAMEALGGPGAEALGYSFRNAIRLNELCNGYLFHEWNDWDELDFQNGFLPFAVSFPESCAIDEDCESYKKLPVSDRRFVQRFLRTANKPRPSTAVTTLLSGEWYIADDHTSGDYNYIFDAVVRQPMGDFDVGDRLCLVVEQPAHQGLEYTALDTFGRVFHGAVRWKVHLPGGLTLIDADGFGAIFKNVRGISSRPWPDEGDLKLDLGPEFRRGAWVRIVFQIHEDLSADLIIRRPPEFMERPESKVSLGLKVTFHSIVWAGLEESSTEESSTEESWMDESSTEESWTDESWTDESSTDESSMDESSTGVSSTEEESAEEIR
ncbi:hypothetical protein HK104_006547 [Borealophlyctis nickersoniae]|nr:hypothetical protein HK104_006547 [Borealophlyctis nickersoniae]